MFEFLKPKNPSFQLQTNSIREDILEDLVREALNVIKEAKMQKPVDYKTLILLEKYKRLKNIGFENSHESNNISLNKIEQQENKERHLINAVNYFTDKYPDNVFIPNVVVDKITNKYSAQIYTATKYIGEVPTQAIDKIEDFKIDEIDECYAERHFRKECYSLNDVQIFTDKETYYNVNDFIELPPPPQTDIRKRWIERAKEPVEVIAERNFFSPFPSPPINKHIVLKPVFFEGKKHYFAVAAWEV
jgi:hypothetical protein